MSFLDYLFTHLLPRRSFFHHATDDESDKPKTLLVMCIKFFEQASLATVLRSIFGMNTQKQVQNPCMVWFN